MTYTPEQLKEKLIKELQAEHVVSIRVNFQTTSQSKQIIQHNIKDIIEQAQLPISKHIITQLRRLVSGDKCAY